MFDSARPDPGTLDVNEALRQQDSETIRVPAIPKTKPCEVCEGRRESYFEVVGYIDPQWRTCWNCNGKGTEPA